jgi:hypothetical protein
MGNDLHARVQTLARLRRGRIGVSNRRDSSGGTARDNYLTGAPYSRQFGLCARAANDRAAEQRDERAAPPSITSSARESSFGGTSRPSILGLASASRPSGEWSDDDYDVLADGKVVGRIFNAAASAANWD